MAAKPCLNGDAESEDEQRQFPDSHFFGFAGFCFGSIFFGSTGFFERRRDATEADPFDVAPFKLERVALLDG